MTRRERARRKKRSRLLVVAAFLFLAALLFMMTMAMPAVYAKGQKYVVVSYSSEVPEPTEQVVPFNAELKFPDEVEAEAEQLAATNNNADVNVTATSRAVNNTDSEDTSSTSNSSGTVIGSITINSKPTDENKAP